MNLWQRWVAKSFPVLDYENAETDPGLAVGKRRELIRKAESTLREIHIQNFLKAIEKHTKR